MKQKWLSLLLIFLLLGICGCSSVSDATPTIEPSATPAPSPTFTITPTPLPTETPTATPTPGPLSASEIFDRISPSIAYIETAAFSGSGLLFEGGYVLTNAHVVWPYNKVRVVFPDGSEFLDTPVVAWDLLADLAVLGPIETNLTPIQLTDGEDRVIGSDVYLIGYPGEVDAFPTPTISRGLISHMREWVLTGISYFQTEAALAGGQSGGVLVTDQGEVIGISGLRFTEADFGIIASAADLIPRIQKLLDRESLGDIDARKIAQEGGQHTHLLTIKPGETAILTVDMVAGEQIDFEINGDDFYWFDLVDPAGTFLLSTEDNATINQSNSGKATFDGLHFLVIGQDYRVNMNSSVSLSSNQVLKLYSDIDDNKSLKLGQTYYGSLDYPSDYDRFLVRLNAGENIHVNVESVLIDPFVWIGYVGAGDEQAAWDDDSGKGVLGADAEVSYSAPHSGMYELYVSDSYGIQSGGYALTVDIWQQGQPTPVVPEPTPTPIISQFGYMQLFENESLRFELEIPFYLIEAPDLVPESFQDICIQDATCLVDPSSGLLLTFAESDLVLWGVETVDELADADIKFMVEQMGAVLEGRDKVLTSGETELIVMRYEFYGMTIERLVTISQQTGLTISYIFLTDEVPKLGPVAEYSLSTFELIK